MEKTGHVLLTRSTISNFSDPHAALTCQGPGVFGSITGHDDGVTVLLNPLVSSGMDLRTTKR